MMTNGKPHWAFYPATILFPPLGVVVGIIAAAKDRVGPALALWATALIGATAWAFALTAILVSVGATSAFDEIGAVGDAGETTATEMEAGAATLDTTSDDAPASETLPRYACSAKYTREIGISAVALSASPDRPNCGGAALMASDIEYDARRSFPEPLPSSYQAFAHGTNTAGDPRASYQCSISTTGDVVLRTKALCVNPAGDSFLYLFDVDGNDATG